MSACETKAAELIASTSEQSRIVLLRFNVMAKRV